MDDKKKEVILCGIVGIVTIIMFCLVTRIWNFNLDVPLQVGDAFGILMNLKSILRDESWSNFTALGAPFHSNLYRAVLPGYQDGYIPNLFMSLFTILTHSVGFGINIYYILSSGCTAMCAYYMLRKADIQRIYSAIGSIIYAFIPGHFLRGESHLYLGSCFVLPLAVVIAMNMCNGKMCKDSLKKREKLSLREVFMSNSREQNFGLLYFALITFCSLYYSIFSLMLLTFCVVYCLHISKKVRNLFYYIQYVIEEFICILLIYLPKILANKFDPLLERVDIVTRNLPDVEIYGGKFIQYVMPINGHRIPTFSKIVNMYNTQFPLVTENAMSSLGMVMSIGFILGILICFFNKSFFSEKLEIYGKMELFMLLVSTIGGFGAVFGMIYYNIRCYNRFSFLIGAVGIIISMKLLQWGCDWIKKQNVGKKRIKIIPIVLSFGVLAVAIFDQTTDGMACSKETGRIMEMQYKNDTDFVENIESYEGDDANILVFPISNAQQAATGISQDGINMSYSDQLLFLHSKTSNWSIGSRAGEKGERWLNWLQSYSVQEQIKIATIVGFSGIAVCHCGYDENSLNQLTDLLSEQLGAPIVENKNGTWTYYSINSVREQLLFEYSKNEIEDMKRRYLNEFVSIQTTGIYDQEFWGRWAEKECKIICNNLGKETLANLDFTIATPGQDGSIVSIMCGGYIEEVMIQGQQEVHLQFPMDRGVNEIYISSSAPDYVAVGDNRHLNIQILDMSLSCNDMTVKINNP